MADKIIKSRIQLKNDLQENWDKATGFVPKDGEIIIYDVDSTYTYPRIKVGDGVNTVTNLPFMNDEITNEQIDSIIETVCGEEAEL